MNEKNICPPSDLDPVLARFIEALARAAARRDFHQQQMNLRASSPTSAAATENSLNEEQKNRLMSPARFKACLTALHWTQRGLAAILEYDDRLIRRWASGDAPIPASVATWLETLTQAHEALPPPQDWKRRF